MQQNIPDEIILISHSLESHSLEEVRRKLTALLNELINSDFQSLVQVLYRIDVNENKIRAYLNGNTNENAADVLAELIIERQMQKIESRKTYHSKNNDTSNEEKW